MDSEARTGFIGGKGSPDHDLIEQIIRDAFKESLDPDDFIIKVVDQIVLRRDYGLLCELVPRRIRFCHSSVEHGGGGFRTNRQRYTERPVPVLCDCGQTGQQVADLYEYCLRDGHYARDGEECTNAFDHLWAELPESVIEMAIYMKMGLMQAQGEMEDKAPVVWPVSNNERRRQAVTAKCDA